MRRDQTIVGGQRSELVAGAGEGKAGTVGQFGCDALAEFGMGVQPGADSGAADGQRGELGQRGGDDRLGVV